VAERRWAFAAFDDIVDALTDSGTMTCEVPELGHSS
jgi:hypothetical protein